MDSAQRGVGWRDGTRRHAQDEAMPALDDLLAWIDARNGIVHTSTLFRAGFSKHSVARAVAWGTVQRIRRSWIVTLACNPDLLAAVQLGGRLTCASAARRAGLWTPAGDGLHLALPRTYSDALPPYVVAHWALPPVPLPRTHVEEHIVNVLFHVAGCMDRASAAAVWESALRKNLVDAPLLNRVHWRSSRASDLAHLASSASDAGTETQFRLLMSDLGIKVTQQVWIDGHPVDGLIGESLVIQIDGFAHHSSPADRRRDIRADARLVLRGFTVLRFDYQQVFFDPTHVTNSVLMAISQQLHRP